jgi:hypothetical protein
VKGEQQIAGMERQTVNHGTGEFVRGDVHTNTAEGFISLLEARHRRHVPSRWQGASRKYVSEFEFRYNARKLADKDRPALIVGRRGREAPRPTSSQLERARIERALYRGRKWKPFKMGGGGQGDRDPLRAAPENRQRHHAPPIEQGRH